ncbi:ty1-copia retrotransposon protein [Cucumis melo var. makuwa]|uniref:Ty1-copia retrotransposon protein n=1 Tax=Cucumis melo var. makuwa TaxID=1194695 RepID=A0A5D3BJE2_CUCMM|nr:ty1-copia retrotransposon protein [Cucumis melo var. makuwa]TYJ99872.1 ty1-copia retrotransposon protein [Cucumis melo var. makuwa]
MKMCEILQANVLLEKSPPSWNDYRNHLKHKKKDLKLQELISHMRTEEANRLKDNLASKNLNSVNANLVKSSIVNSDRTKHDKEHKGKNSEKRQFKAPRRQIKKKKLVCYVCGKEGHKSYQCNQRKGRPNQKPTPQANLAEQDNEIIAAIVEANLIENKTNWILDTGASRHFCTNLELLHDYEDTTDEEYVFMGNSATARVIGKGKVILKLTSGKTLSLSNVLYVPSLRRNLVSGSLLNRAGLKIILEGDKVVLTNNEEFVGKRYLSNSLFVLNTFSMNANASSSAYMIESVNLWHGRLGHVNFASIRKLKDLRLINTSESHETGKCPVYVENEDPKTYQEALNSVESSMWKDAIKSELDSLVMNQTWDLVDLPMGSKPIKLRTPFNANKHHKKNKGDSVSQPEYAKIIGSVMYLMNYNRPGIAYVVSRLSRYTHNPEVNSTSGAISWKSAKQTYIARFTMESKFIALELARHEAGWIKNLLGDVPLWGTSVPVSI